MQDATTEQTTPRDLEEGAPRAPRLMAAHAAPSPSRVMETMDRAVARALFVQTQKTVATTSSRLFDTPLLISAARCILRYILLPFILPLLGIATGAALGAVTGAALGVLLLLDTMAAVSIIATLRRLWRLQHPRRWQYLAVAGALALLMGLFFVNDVKVLFA